MLKFILLVTLSVLSFEYQSAMASSQREINDDKAIKGSICEAIRNGFNPMNTAYSFQLAIDGVESQYQYFPLQADKMFGVYIPSRIYPDFYQLLKSIALNQTDPKTALTNALEEWDARLYSQDDGSPFTVRLDHKEKKDLSIFFGFFAPPENFSNIGIPKNVQDDPDEFDDFDDEALTGTLDTDYCSKSPPKRIMDDEVIVKGTKL